VGGRFDAVRRELLGGLSTTVGGHDGEA